MSARPCCGVSTGAAWVPGLASLPAGETKTAEPALPDTGREKVTPIVVSACTLLSTHDVSVPAQVPPVQPATANPAFAVAVTVTLSPTGMRHLPWLVQLSAGLPASVMPTVPSSPAVATTVAVGVTANVAASVSVTEAVRWQGLSSPGQLPPDQLVSWLPELGLAVIVIASPTSARQLATPEGVTLVQLATPGSLIATPPLPVPAVAVIVTVLANVAVSVSFEVAANGAHAVPVQVPPLHFARRLPDAAVGVIVIVSPTSARQLVTPVQLAIPGSLIVAVPLPVPVVAVVIVTVFVNVAVSPSAAEALNLQGLVAAVQVPPDQPVRRLPDAAVAVIVIASPTSARQLVTPVQPPIALASMIVAVPLPPPVGVGAVIRTVFAKAAVSVSFEAAANVQGLMVAVQVPPDQPVRRLPDPAVAVIVIESPTL